ncbi:hypothetical protein F5148DRAFT_1326557, partial [Russula earlei]
YSSGPPFHSGSSPLSRNLARIISSSVLPANLGTDATPLDPKPRLLPAVSLPPPPSPLLLPVALRSPAILHPHPLVLGPGECPPDRSPLIGTSARLPCGESPRRSPPFSVTPRHLTVIEPDRYIADPVAYAAYPSHSSWSQPRLMSPCVCLCVCMCGWVGGWVAQADAGGTHAGIPASLLAHAVLHDVAVCHRLGHGGDPAGSL